MNVWMSDSNVRIYYEYWGSVHEICTSFRREWERERGPNILFLLSVYLHIFFFITYEKMTRMYLSIEVLFMSFVRHKERERGERVGGQKLMSVLIAFLQIYSYHNERDKSPKIFSVMRFCRWNMYIETTERSPNILPVLSVYVHIF